MFLFPLKWIPSFTIASGVCVFPKIVWNHQEDRADWWLSSPFLHSQGRQRLSLGGIYFSRKLGLSIFVFSASSSKASSVITKYVKLYPMPKFECIVENIELPLSSRWKKMNSTFILQYCNVKHQLALNYFKNSINFCKCCLKGIQQIYCMWSKNNKRALIAVLSIIDHTKWQYLLQE